MHLAGEFTANILHRSYLEIENNIDYDHIEGLIRIARLWGLIHDIGHGPFSHSFEYYTFFEKNLSHEKIVPLIYRDDKNFRKTLDEIVNQIKGYYDDSLSSELILDFFKDEDEATELQKYEILFIISKLIKGDIYSIDEIDYNLRDSYYCGTQEYGTIDWKRLMYLTWLIKIKTTDKIAIALEEKAKQCLVDYYWAKYSMYSAVYYHNRCHAVEQYLRDILLFLKGEGIFSEYLDDNNFENFHNLDDNLVLNELLYPQKLSKVKGKGKEEQIEILREKYTDHKNKLMALYNFEIPYCYIGSATNTRINNFFNTHDDDKKLFMDISFQDQFRKEISKIFKEEIVKKKDESPEISKILNQNKDFAKEIFFQHIKISSNERFFVETKIPAIYLLNERMNEYKVKNPQKEIFNNIPIEGEISKILIPKKLYDVLLENYSSFFELIKNCFENLIVEDPFKT